jgi:hypothetical protein
VAEGTNNKDVKYMEMKARCYSSDNGRMRWMHFGDLWGCPSFTGWKPRALGAELFPGCAPCILAQYSLATPAVGQISPGMAQGTDGKIWLSLRRAITRMYKVHRLGDMAVPPQFQRIFQTT